MEIYSALAISSVEAAQMGPDLLMLIATFVLYNIGLTKTIYLIDRHEHAPDDFKVDAVIWISFFCTSIGAVIGNGVYNQASTIIIYALGFCGATSFLASALLIGFRFPKCILTALAAPVVLVLAASAGHAIHLLAAKLIPYIT